MAKKDNAEPVYVDKSGKRLDGRKLNELRPIRAEVGVLPRADGSAYFEWGQNKIIASVYGPHECIPKHLSSPYGAVLRYNYRMATFSVPDRKNPRPGRREIEISKISAEALSSAVFLERFPDSMIEVDVEVLDSNAGTRIAALSAASLALADAGIPMRDLVVGVTVGKAGGHIMVDLTKEEEDAPDAVDIPLAILPHTGEIVLLQLDGLMKKDEWQKALKLAQESCKKPYELQRETLLAKYKISERQPAKKEVA